MIQKWSGKQLSQHFAGYLLGIIVVFSRDSYSLVCPDVAIHDPNFVYKPPITCKEFLKRNGAGALDLYDEYAHNLSACSSSGGHLECVCPRARRSSPFVHVETYGNHISNIGVYRGLEASKQIYCEHTCSEVYYAVLQSNDPLACACVNIRACAFTERNFTVSTKPSQPTSSLLVIPNDFVSQVYVLDCNKPRAYSDDALDTIIRCERKGLGFTYTRPDKCDDEGAECEYNMTTNKWEHKCRRGEFWQESLTGPCTACRQCPKDEYVVARCTPRRDTQCEKVETGLEIQREFTPGACTRDGDFYDKRTYECRRCPANAYEVNSTCEPCPENYDSSRSDGVICTPCQASFFRAAQGPECIACPPGQYRDVTQSKCVKCHPHHVNPGGHASCVECGALEYANKEQSACLLCELGKTWNNTKKLCIFCESRHVLVNDTCRTCLLSPLHTCPTGQYLDDCSSSQDSLPCVCGCRKCNRMMTDATGTCHNTLVCSNLSHYYHPYLRRCFQRNPLAKRISENLRPQSMFNIRDQSTDEIAYCSDLFPNAEWGRFQHRYGIKLYNGTDTDSKALAKTILVHELAHEREVQFFRQSEQCHVACTPGRQWLQVDASAQLYQCVKTTSLSANASQCVLHIKIRKDAQTWKMISSMS